MPTGHGGLRQKLSRTQNKVCKLEKNLHTFLDKVN